MAAMDVASDEVLATDVPRNDAANFITGFGGVVAALLPLAS